MKIFISYAHDDASHVMSMQQALSSHEVWYDQRLSVGQQWWEEIQGQIAGCHCFLFVLSPRSMESEYCQKELDYALKLDKPIAPVMIENMSIPEKLSRFQVIETGSEFTSTDIAKLLNGLFEIERQVFNPFKQLRHTAEPLTQLAVTDLYFATTNLRKKMMYEKILNVTLQTAAIELADLQHVDAGEVALYKVKQAYDILKKPVFVEHSALAVRAWGGLPGGMTTHFLVPAGLTNICKMLHPFPDKYAEAISAIAFTDGQLIRKFIGVVPGVIVDAPRGNGYSWNNIFIPAGFDKTLGEMSEDEFLSLSSRRRVIIEFMRFLQYNYEMS